jgi:hypothetical protein
MTALLIRILARWGVPEGLQRVAAWVMTLVAVIALLALLWALHGHWERNAYNQAFNAGWSALAKANADEAAKVLEINDAAKDKAAAERVTDTAIITNQQDTRNVAISAARPSSTGAATHALGCVRWAQQHPSSKTKPAGC